MFIDIEYEVLDKETGENASELFFKIIKECYEGSKGWGQCRKDIDVISCKFPNNIEVLVSDKPFYNKRNSSVIIIGDSNTKISKTESYLEKETKLKLKKVENGN